MPWRRARSRHGGWETGQSTFELIGYTFAVLVVAVMCVQAVYVSQAAATAQQAARDGARAYTLGQPVGSAVDAQLPGWLEEEGSPRVTFPTASSVKVEVTVHIPVMMGNRKVGTVTMSRSAEMPTAPKNFLADPKTPGKVSGLLDPSTLCPLSWAPSRLLRCDAAAALEQLNVAYRARFGTNIVVTDAYRDIASQIALYNGPKRSLAAFPGTSNHGWGIAVDLGGGMTSDDSDQYRWMKENSTTYGWYHPAWAERGGSSKFEPWHWEFGG